VTSLYDQPLVYRMFFDSWTADVPFYRALASAQGGEVLECGIGAGRLALALAREGHRVHGVDLDASMLASLSTRLADEPPEVRPRVTFERADVKTMKLGRTFPLIVAPFNGIAHQHRREDLRAFLEGVRAHLAPSGLFAFDVWIPDPRLMMGSVADSPRFRDPRTGTPTRCTERQRYDAISQVLTVEMELTSIDAVDQPERLSLSLRQLFPEETRILLEACGFEVVFRTSRFTPMIAGARAVEDEGADERGEMLAWVCRIP
jgi:SAM-dependent methyltransferase